MAAAGDNCISLNNNDNDNSGRSLCQSNNNNNNKSSNSNTFIVRVVFFWLGVGILLPWNSFISAKPYFESRFCESSSGTVALNVELWFGMVSNVSSVLTLGIIVLYKYMQDEFILTRHADDHGSDDSRRRRHHNHQQQQQRRQTMSVAGSSGNWVWPLWIYLGVLVLTTVTVLLPQNDDILPVSFFCVFTLAGLFLCGVCQSIVSAEIVARAGLCEPHVGIHPYFTGQAMGGVLVALVNVFTASIANPQAYTTSTTFSSNNNNSQHCVPYEKTQWTAFIYFVLGCIVIAFCIHGWCFILKCQDDKHLEEITRRRRLQSAGVGHDDDDYYMLISDTMETSSESTDTEGLIAVDDDDDDEYDDDDEEAPRNDSPTIKIDTTLLTNETMMIWKELKWNAIALFSTYLVTLTLFPVWTSELTAAAAAAAAPPPGNSNHNNQQHNRFLNDLYTPMTFLIFNVGDLVGRMMASASSFPRIRPFYLAVASWLRCIFFVLFLYCAARDSVFQKQKQQQHHVLQQSNVYSYTVQALFALSNGMLNSLCFLQNNNNSTMLLSTRAQEKASEILNLALSLGLLVGSFVSFPYFRFATGHW